MDKSWFHTEDSINNLSDNWEKNYHFESQVKVYHVCSSFYNFLIPYKTFTNKETKPKVHSIIFAKFATLDTGCPSDMVLMPFVKLKPWRFFF